MASAPRKEVPTMTPEQQQLRWLIINTADSAFRQRGIKKVTMDDVSKKLRMSKRTLYQFFTDKEALVMACVKANLDREQHYGQRVLERANNVLEVLLAFTEYRVEDFRSVCDAYLTDILDYPVVARYFKDRRTAIDQHFMELLEIGIRQGLFRPDTSSKVVVHCLASLTDNVIHRKDMEEISIESFIRNFVLVLFRGCATEEGCRIIEQFQPRLPELHPDIIASPLPRVGSHPDVLDSPFSSNVYF